MTTNLIIIGAGELGRETLNWASQSIEHGAPWKIKGFLDSRPDVLNGYDYSVKILGDVEHYAIAENDVFVGAIGDPREKVKFYTPIHERGGQFINLIHPLATIGKNVRLGTGVILAPFSSITCDAQVGNHVTLLSYSNAGHDTVIDDWCQISGHCGINGGVALGKGAFLGSHTCLIPKTQIGAGAYVGAGSVVLQDVAAGVKVFGNPAVPFGKM